MDNLKISKKGLFVDVSEQFNIYANTNSDKHLTDVYSDRDIPTYDVATAGPYTTAAQSKCQCTDAVRPGDHCSNRTRHRHQIIHVSHFQYNYSHSRNHNK
jgi:hypothetical protein